MSGNNDNSFFSMDRLVEFGMGMAMSQQIVQSMNNMMNQMNVPPQIHVGQQGFSLNPSQSASGAVPGMGVVPGIPVAGRNLATPVQPYTAVPSQPVSKESPPSVPQSAPAAPPPLPEVYYVVQDGKQTGPYNGTEIARLVMEKKVSASTSVWKTGMSEWQKADSFPELLCLISMVPPPVVGDVK